MRTRPTRRSSFAAIVGLGIVAAAIPTISEAASAEIVVAVASTTTTAAAPTTAASTTAVATTAVATTAVATTSAATTDDGPQGPDCAAIPAGGEGSFVGMADDPAATAASNNPELSTLSAAVAAAGLVDTLNGPGPFTIFAPNEDAFAEIPPTDLDAIIADTALLTSILTYHVIAGQSLSVAELAAAGTVATVQGADLTFTTDANGSLIINGGMAMVSCTNIPVANGTVQVIDSVLTPPPAPLVEVL